MKYHHKLTTLVLATALASCGGGDDAPTGTAEGIWGGTTSSGLLTALIVLETGETWGVYSDGVSNAGLLHGTTTTSGYQVSGSVTDFSLLTPSTWPASYAGSFVPKTSMNITISPSGATLAATYDASYDIPVNMYAVAGNYVAELVTAQGVDENVALTVDSTGQLFATLSTPGCTAAGSLTGRPTGKAIMNLSLTFSGAACLVPGGTTITGVTKDGNDVLVGMGLNASQTQGLLLLAAKPI